MEQEFIDKLTTEDLQLYAASPQLVGTLSYTKVNSKGQATYLSESEAIQESALINKKRGNLIQPMDQGLEEDSYMRIFYLVSYMGNAKYKFSTDARWLTMPYFRGKDSIGSCAQNATVTNSTRSGWYECEIYNLFGTKIDDLYSNINSSSFKNAVNGSWYGSAAILTLPDDFSTRPVKVHKNFKVHYEYQGHVNYPDSASWFNTIGSYDHATIAISFTPSVSIDLGGPTSAAIGLDIIGSTDTRSVELEMYYKP